MRKLIVFNMISVDGHYAGTDGNIDWHVVDDEFNHYAIEVLESIDTILFGRVTYKIFEDYWPNAKTDPKLSAEDHQIAELIDNASKIVVSKSMDSTNWKNTALWHVLDPDEIKKLKDHPGKDIIIYGSGTVVQQLTNLGLIDEYRLMVNPVILGAGKPLFAHTQQTKLKLHSTKTFASGNVLLTYQKG